MRNKVHFQFVNQNGCRLNCDDESAAWKHDLSSPETVIPQVGRVRAHGRAAGRGRAGLDANRTVRPGTKCPLYPCLNVFREAQTIAIIFKLNVGTKPPSSTGESAVYHRSLCDLERSFSLAAKQWTDACFVSESFSCNVFLWTRPIHIGRTRNLKKGSRWGHDAWQYFSDTFLFWSLFDTLFIGIYEKQVSYDTTIHIIRVCINVMRSKFFTNIWMPIQHENAEQENKLPVESKTRTYHSWPVSEQRAGGRMPWGRAENDAEESVGPEANGPASPFLIALKRFVYRKLFVFLKRNISFMKQAAQALCDWIQYRGLGGTSFIGTNYGVSCTIARPAPPTL